MNKSIVPIALYLTIVIVTGCASAPTRQSAPFADQSSEQVDANKSRVYVIRPGMKAFPFSAEIKDDNHVIGELGPRGYLSWEREPGSMHVNSVLDGDFSLAMDTKPGETVYLLLGSGDIFGDMRQFSRLEKDEALDAFYGVDPPRNIYNVNQWFKTGMIEPWYYYMRVAVNPTPTYFGALKQREQDMRQRIPATVSRARLSLVNMYLPLSNNQTLVGMRLINMGWDGYENATSNETFYQSGFFGVSAMHFFNKPLGAGLFGRVDAGLANFDHSNDNTEHSLLDENGFDLEVSIGYGVPLGKQTKILVSLDDNLASFPSGRVNTWAVSVGLMW